MVFSEFLPDHVKPVAKLLSQTFKEIGMSEKKSLMEAERVRSTSLAFVAMRGGKVVGFALASSPANDIYLSWFAVASSERGEGIGAGILDLLEKTAKKKKVRTITLDTRNRFKRANVLYVKRGYDIIGTWAQTDGETMIRFRKKL